MNTPVEKDVRHIQRKIDKKNKIKVPKVFPLILVHCLICIIISIAIFILSRTVFSMTARIIAHISLTVVIMAGFVVRDILVYLTAKRKKNQLRKEINEDIVAVNTKIDKYNKNHVKKEIENRDNKIMNFEKKRVENFNYPLEFALDRLSSLQKQYSIFDDMGTVNYSLQFYPYPEDYEEKKQEYYGEYKEEKTKKWTYLFDDL